MMNAGKRSWLQPVYCYGIIVAVGFILYVKTLCFKLTYLDDNVWLLDYYWYLKNLSNFPQLFLQPDLISGVFYRPILNFSFMLNAVIAGSSPWIYHLTNIMIHVVNGCLVFTLLRKLGYLLRLSLLASLVWVTHPVLTQAVVWIPGRTDSFLALWIFISLISFLKSLETKACFYYICHLFFFLLACLTKETAVIFPLICLLWINLILKPKPSFKKQLFFVLGWAFILLGWLIARGIVLSHSRAISVEEILKSILENSPGFISYLGKVYLPVNLSVMPIPQDTTLMYGFVTMIALIPGLIFSKNKRTHYIIFGVACFFLFMFHSLVVSFLNHEYRLYLPIFGCMVVTLEMHVVKKIGIQGSKAWIAATLVIILFFIMTFRYSDRFKDRFTFWESAVKTSPHSPLAHRNLGAMHHLEGRLEKAELEYKKAMELNPYEHMVHNNLGLIYADRGDLKAAEMEYRTEIRINPTYDNVYYNFGLLYLREGRFQEAEAHWKKTIELNPKYIDAYKQLLIYYLNQKDFVQAAFYAQELKKRGIVLPPRLFNKLK